MATPLPLETVARLWELLEAGVSTTEAARELGIQWFTANYWARRVRRGEPWAEDIEPYTCAVCGQPGLAAVRARRRVHPACGRPHRAIRSRQRRAMRAPGGLSTPFVQRWREEHPAAAARLRIAERRRRPVTQELIERAHEYDREAAAVAAASATANRAPYSQDDDTEILARARDNAIDIALDLGRTLWSIRSRRSKLLRERPEMREVLANTTERRGHWLWPEPETEADAAATLWRLTYPVRAMAPNPCPQAACIRPSHRS